MNSIILVNFKLWYLWLRRRVYYSCSSFDSTERNADSGPTSSVRWEDWNRDCPYWSILSSQSACHSEIATCCLSCCLAHCACIGTYGCWCWTWGWDCCSGCICFNYSAYFFGCCRLRRGWLADGHYSAAGSVSRVSFRSLRAPLTVFASIPLSSSAPTKAHHSLILAPYSAVALAWDNPPVFGAECQSAALSRNFYRLHCSPALSRLSVWSFLFPVVSF